MCKEGLARTPSAYFFSQFKEVLSKISPSEKGLRGSGRRHLTEPL